MDICVANTRCKGAFSHTARPSSEKIITSIYAGAAPIWTPAHDMLEDSTCGACLDLTCDSPRI